MTYRSSPKKSTYKKKRRIRYGGSPTVAEAKAARDAALLDKLRAEKGRELTPAEAAAERAAAAAREAAAAQQARAITRGILQRKKSRNMSCLDKAKERVRLPKVAYNCKKPPFIKCEYISNLVDKKNAAEAAMADMLAEAPRAARPPPPMNPAVQAAVTAARANPSYPLFGSAAAPPDAAPAGGPFGAPPSFGSAPAGSFGNSKPTAPARLFGGPATATAPSQFTFGATPAAAARGASNPSAPAGSLFGSPTAASSQSSFGAAQPTVGSVFGSQVDLTRTLPTKSQVQEQRQNPEGYARGLSQLAKPTTTAAQPAAAVATRTSAPPRGRPTAVATAARPASPTRRPTAAASRPAVATAARPAVAAQLPPVTSSTRGAPPNTGGNGRKRTKNERLKYKKTKIKIHKQKSKKTKRRCKKTRRR